MAQPSKCRPLAWRIFLCIVYRTIALGLGVNPERNAGVAREKMATEYEGSGRLGMERATGPYDGDLKNKGRDQHLEVLDSAIQDKYDISQKIVIRACHIGRPVA